jgi:regulation of enolase protein 1 (concanavalin A-like superfamily)
VLKKMAEKGWTCNHKETDKLRLQTSPNTFWFRETIYVFERYSRE